MSRRLFRTFAALLLSTAIFTAAGQQHPNQARGFAADKLYAFSGLDSVSTFNGNMNLRIPIGQEYLVGGGFSYRLMLAYNSNVWDYETGEVSVGELTELQTVVFGNRLSNAGLGWQLTLGELYPPLDPRTHSGRWVFASSDGGQHTFYEELQGGDDVVPGVYYTRDSTYLRLRVPGAGVAYVDHPDGSVFEFKPLVPTSLGEWRAPYAGEAADVRWKLTEIGDAFGNKLTIKYSTPGPSATYSELWTMDDGRRVHKVYFRRTSGGQYESALDRIELTAFGGATATYTFIYDETNVQKLSIDDSGTGQIFVPLLKRIVLPDGTAFEPQSYDISGETSGVLRALRLPTKGYLRWTYTYAMFPATSEEGPGRDRSLAVSLRETRDQNDAVLGSTTYKRAMGNLELCQVTCSNGSSQCSSGSQRQFATAVTAPDGTHSIYYYSVYSYAPQKKGASGDECSVGAYDWHSAEYGLPFTRFVPESTGKFDGRFLSTEVRTGTLPPVLPVFDGRLPLTVVEDGTTYQTQSVRVRSIGIRRVRA
jgi:hypothetical protein